MIACLLSTGFTVDRDEPSGIALIAASLRERLPKGSYIYQGEWDEDWAEIARSEPVQAASVVALIDHSYGWIGHVKFCAAYAPKRVELMCPIDPVPRWWSNMIQAVAGAALGRPIGTLQLPATVDRCLYWRQVQARPYGRSVQGTVATCPVCWQVIGVALPDCPECKGRGWFLSGTVYANDAARARLKPWESLKLCPSNLDHNAIDDWPAVHRQIVAAVTHLAGSRV